MLLKEQKEELLNTVGKEQNRWAESLRKCAKRVLVHVQDQFTLQGTQKASNRISAISRL